MLAFVAFAVQAAFAQTLPSPPYANNPNIEIPSSSALHWYDLKLPHTEYLIWKGPDPRSGYAATVETSLFGPLLSGFPPGFHPSDVRNAYNVTGMGSNGLAVVDLGDLTTALKDFNNFSLTFGLPQEPSANVTSSTNKVFQVVYEHPGVVPTADVASGWNIEEALDIEWAHAMAPNAKLYVIESDDGDLSYCNQVASQILNLKEVSNSWIQYEEPLGTGEFAYDHYFTTPGVTYYAGSGDDGAIFSGYPSTSPSVVSVGGTSLFMNEAGTVVTGETAWNGSGGGPSLYEPVPTYQSTVPSVSRLVGSYRGTPDLAAIADPNTGVSVYTNGSWYVIGGTSVATPVVAGIVNSTDTFFASSTIEHNLIYSLLGTSSFRDITSGVSGNYTATVGWDFVTGCGAPLNLTHPVVYYTESPDQASTLTGTYQSGTSSSLASTDGNDYVVKGVLFSGLGATADVRAHFTIPNSVPAQSAGATITVTAKASAANVVNEIFLYNTVTKNYDLLGTPLLSTSNLSYAINLSVAQAPNYIDSSGNVVVLSRALLPQKSIIGSNSAYTYSVDQISVKYGFYIRS
jgi:kumamolisin